MHKKFNNIFYNRFFYFFYNRTKWWPMMLNISPKLFHKIFLSLMKYIYWRIKFKVTTLKPPYLLKKKKKTFETTIIVKLFTPKWWPMMLQRVTGLGFGNAVGSTRPPFGAGAHGPSLTGIFLFYFLRITGIFIYDEIIVCVWLRSKVTLGK